jgi:hypothetical protein
MLMATALYDHGTQYLHSHLDFKDLPARRSLLVHLVRHATVAVALLQLPLLPA